MKKKAEIGDDASARTVRLVVFHIDDRRYALPLDEVHEVVRAVAIQPLPGAPEGILGAVNLRGLVVPVVDSRTRFGHEPRELRLSDHFLVATAGDRRFILPCDHVHGVERLRAEALAQASELAPGLATLSGVAKHPEGLILVADLADCLEGVEA